MVIDHVFDVFHDLGVAAVGLGGHVGYGTFGFEDACGLGVQDEGDGEEAFDPFWSGVSECWSEDWVKMVEGRKSGRKPSRVALRGIT